MEHELTDTNTYSVHNNKVMHNLIIEPFKLNIDSDERKRDREQDRKVITRAENSIDISSIR